jgi:hypothetical protein
MSQGREKGSDRGAEGFRIANKIYTKVFADVRLSESPFAG